MLVAFTSGTAAAQSCVVLNEIMINPSGACDGSCVPATAEWVELYNTCDIPVDIGCFVLTDEDFSVVFPPGTVIGPGDFFVIGSPNSGVSVNLDWSTCNCTSSNGMTQIGIFTNGNEQLALFDANGVMQDGIWWGAGQFDQQSSIVSVAISGCAEQTLSLTADMFTMPALPSQTGNEDGTIHRICDGASEWVSNNQITPGSSNGGSGGIIEPSFTLNSLDGCPGDCFTVTNTTGGSPASYSWNLPSGTSFDANPAPFCIPEGGNFDVSLTIPDGCQGTITVTQTIAIQNTAEVALSTPGSLNVCEGEEVLLIVSGAQNADGVQWFLNGAETGLNNDSLSANTGGMYSAIVTWGNCFAFTNELQVNISNELEVSISALTGNFLCPGSTAVLQATPGFSTYTWTINGQIESAVTGSVLSTTSEGTYSVAVTSEGCAGESGDFPLSAVEVTPLFIQASDVLLCPNEFTTLQATPAATSYSWLLDNDYIADATTFFYQTDQPGTYTLEVVDTNGCIVLSNEIVIDAVGASPVSIEADGPIEFCEGSSVSLSVAGDFVSIQWSDNGFVLPGENGSVLLVNETGAYSVEVIDDNGCEVLSELFQVFVYPVPVVSIFPAGPVISSCFPVNTLQAVVLNNVQGLLQWLDEDGLPVAGATDNTFGATAGLWSLQVTTAEGCVGSSAPVEVIVTEPVIPALELSPAEPCDGELVSLSLIGNYTNINWSIGFTTPSITIGAPGTYSVVALDVNNCPVQATRLVNFKPLPEVFAGNDTISDCTIGVLLNGSGDGTLSWSPEESVTNPNNAVTTVNPEVTTTYTLTANLNGCQASADVTVVAECPFILIPNVFTPNQSGANEQLRILYRGIETFEWKVFNRWGQLMWETTNPDDAWDGDEASEGTYFYTMRALNRAGESLFDTPGKEGTITLLR